MNSCVPQLTFTSWVPYNYIDSEPWERMKFNDMKGVGEMSINLLNTAFSLRILTFSEYNAHVKCDCKEKSE